MALRKDAGATRGTGQSRQ